VARVIPRKPRRDDDPPIDPAEATRDVLARCEKAGFASAGVAPVQGSAFAQELRAWLKAGKHGEMDFLERDNHIREEPGKIMQGVGEGVGDGVHDRSLQARAFIVVADQYASRQDDGGQPKEPLHGRVARYARGRNYHDVMKKRLHALADALRIDYPGSDFRTCVDTAPIMERELAALAGIGWQAKNTLIINPRLGSYVLLGVVATTLPLIPTSQRVPDSCGTCTRCIDACPTHAITPYSVDATRCVSYLTIERRSPIPLELHAGVGDWIFGCDICQEVCPHNSPRPDPTRTGETHPAYDADAARASLPLLEVLGWSENDRREAFKTSPMKRANLAMMRRNALIALGNSIIAMARVPTDRARASELRDMIVCVADDANQPEMVQQTARDVLRSLEGVA
jgi:epoxyqueuosine reductase